MNVHATKGDFEEAHEVMTMTARRGVRCGHVDLYTSLLNAHVTNGDVDGAHEVMVMICDAGVDANTQRPKRRS